MLAVLNTLPIGASGIGKHFAQTLVKSGAKVVIGDINEKGGIQVVKLINEA